MKKLLSVVLMLTMVIGVRTNVYAKDWRNNEAEYTNENVSGSRYDCRSVVLMEAGTGKILYEENSDAAYSPASVTKIMTLLLVMEALENGAFTLDQKVTVSEYAASMGGSQVYLKEGESISVEDLIKCTVIASANDAAVALCELVAGSEENFVRKMNAKAMELGMKSSNFENVTGLDDTAVNHVQSAMDIAIASRELIKHEIITRYSSIWQDSIRDGAFVLTNTNRLVRFYDGCTGLKTGSTDKAGFCISTTAKRGNMHLIAVVMGAPTRDERNAIARELLDLGFAEYTLYEAESEHLGSFRILRSNVPSIDLYTAPLSVVIGKADERNVEKRVTLPESFSAPISKGSEVGKVEYLLNGEMIAEVPIYSDTEAREITFGSLYFRMLLSLFMPSGKM